MIFDASVEPGLHACRVVCRVRLLAGIPTTRLDCEGFDRVDVEATSHSAFTKWRKQLSSEQQTSLRTWRMGAMGSPTRYNGWHSIDKGCPWCNECFASLRHFAADCPRFDALRAELLRRHRVHVPLTWYAAQPRISLKSGWVTLDAHDDAKHRALLQVVLCDLGLAIMDAYFAHRG